ncbi:MAG: hypothetical protein N2037_06370 [Acidimicrobiales bacterium]|nr:hypothetical protein [Acidimicrobiales bacterium]
MADARPRIARPLIVAVVASVLVVASFSAAVFLRRSQRDQGYSPAVYASFMEACTRDGGEPVRPVCQCIWDRATQDVPYGRFEQINDELLAQEADRGRGVPLDVPDDFGVIVQECAEQMAPVVTPSS